MENPVQIIFTDDKEKFRKAILDELKLYNIECIGQAENGKQLLKLLEVKTPDVVLLDLEMPVMDGNEAMKQIMELYPETKVIILSLYNESLLVEDYIRRGAKGYLAKDEIAGDIELLAHAIERVSEGEVFISLRVEKVGKKHVKIKGYSSRQKEIIPLLCEGKTNKEISEEIGIVVRSVEKQRQKIYEKTNSSKSIDFFKYAFVRGLQFLGGPRQYD